MGVIGGGIFGLSCALSLGSHHEVTIIEKAATILAGASYGNQNRFHYGYHYPRSQATARECLDSLKLFLEKYGSAVLSDFQNYYCVANEGSKTSPEDYIKFCDTVSIPHTVEWPPETYLNRNKISVCFRVPEPILDLPLLRRIIDNQLPRYRTIDLLLRSRAVLGRKASNGKKILTVETDGIKKDFEFDYIVNATYNNLNDMCEWFGFDRRRFQYELVEIPVISIRNGKRIGLTVMDGPFCSILPYGLSRQTLLYHAKESVLDMQVAHKYVPRDCYSSNWTSIIDRSLEFMPILASVDYHYSIMAMRAVDPESERDDARRSELIEHEPGCWSIFSGKMISACKIAEELASRVETLDRTRTT